MKTFKKYVKDSELEDRRNMEINVIPKLKKTVNNEKFRSFPRQIFLSDKFPESCISLFRERMKKLDIHIYIEELNMANKENTAEFRVLYERKKDMKPESYELDCQEEKIKVYSADESGADYALTTIYWMALAEQLCIGKIYDEPKMSYRSLLLDVSRHFFSAEEVKKILEQCALLKINHFHWHFSDDWGYRLESRGYPKLHEIGARRKEREHGYTKGYYTQKEIKEIVCFAQKRNITIVPELDMPGHALALLASYPELGCNGEKLEVGFEGGIETHLICAGKPFSYAFLEALLDELCELFPGEYFHIGGDEAPKDIWKECPDCRAMVEKEKLADFEELQSFFMNHMISYLEKKGKKVICWNDAFLTGKIKETAVMQYWDELHPNTAVLTELSKGRKVILSNISRFYANYGYGLIPLQSTYEYEPQMLGKAISEEQMEGVELAVWTEWIASEEMLEKFLFPRLCAFAEAAWSEEKVYTDFRRRLSLWKRQAEAEKIAISTAWEDILYRKNAEKMVLQDGLRMQMAEKNPEKTLEANLADARRKMEGWLKFLQGEYYSEMDRETIFEEIRKYMNEEAVLE